VYQHDPTFTFPLQTAVVAEPEAPKYWKEAKAALKKYQQDAREIRYCSHEELLDHYESDIHNPESGCQESQYR
jgi:hypothetical protein